MSMSGRAAACTDLTPPRLDIASVRCRPSAQVLRKGEKEVKKAAPRSTPKLSLPSVPKLPSFGTVKKEVKKSAPPQVHTNILRIHIVGYRSRPGC